MSWFSRAKEFAGSINVRDGARNLASGVLASVATRVDDKMRRVVQGVHGRLTGRQSFEEAVSCSAPTKKKTQSLVSFFAGRGS